ncbi:MAG: hypothetical protein Q4C42_09410 [Clostridia bacterium]|nr:hypothetical protein [Clostridia bacterium]
MLFNEKEIILKNGEKCLLRPVAVSDAQDMIDYLRTVSGETPYLLRYPDEVTFTKTNY